MSFPATVPLHPTHPYFILEHLVKNVLPRKCRKDCVQEYYRQQLDDPEAAIEECKGKLADWVLQYWSDGKLDNVDRLKQQATTEFPNHGVVYLIILVIDGELWRYVGQAEDAHARIVGSHQRESYRSVGKLSFLYFLWPKAQEVHFCLPISDVELVPGPILNILEQWVSLLFCGLQPSELKSNFVPETLEHILSDVMHRGVNVREPLAQGFQFCDFPMTGASFQYSPHPFKKEFYELKRNHQVTHRRHLFLQNDLFGGSFWGHGPFYYRFSIGYLEFEIGRTWIDRLEPETIRIHCDIVPPGQVHPETVIRGMYSPPKYDDSAPRLGIKVSGTRKGDQQEGWVWVQKTGDRWIPRVNRLFDWLEGLDTTQLRPRRWYPAHGGNGDGLYTRHPLWFKPGLEEKWMQLVTFEEYEASSIA